MSMKHIISAAVALACFTAAPVYAQSYLPEMSGGCAQYVVEAITDTGFYYVIWQKDKDTLANGQQIRDDKTEIKPINVRSMKPGYVWGLSRVDDDGKVHWTVAGTAIHVTEETIVMDQWSLYNNRGTADPLLDVSISVVQFVKIKPPQTQPPGGQPPGGGV